jgi:hypothetical protein
MEFKEEFIEMTREIIDKTINILLDIVSLIRTN